MASLDMTVKHGLSWDEARAHFVKGVADAEAKYGAQIKQVEWSEDRTEVRLVGPGFDVVLRVDPDAVHATGRVPFFLKLLEGRARKFVEEAIGSA
jgi:hypothetical protein